MNRHETHPERGRVFDEEHARDDLALMKRFNVNAIRTSHYPPHPRLLDLADELGFWVILECDLETHGFERTGLGRQPQRRPGVARGATSTASSAPSSGTRTTRRSSCGRSATRPAPAATSPRCRRGSMPATPDGPCTTRATTPASTPTSTRGCTPRVPETEPIGRDGSARPAGLLPAPRRPAADQAVPPVRVRARDGQRPRARIDQYEDLVDRYPRLHGGFVWEWRDHGIRTTHRGRHRYFAYGGDFGEVVHDGNFVMDGMVLPDRRRARGCSNTSRSWRRSV